MPGTNTGNCTHLHQPAICKPPTAVVKLPMLMMRYKILKKKREIFVL
jgi:hypothetical protein